MDGSVADVSPIDRASLGVFGLIAACVVGVGVMLALKGRLDWQYPALIGAWIAALAFIGWRLSKRQ